MPKRALLASLALLAPASNGEEIVVPDDFPTVQGAIDAASDGDVVRIKPGVYLENLSLAGKTITLESTDGPEVTIIDANDTGTVITLESGEGPETLIRGLTLKGGNATGSAIYCLGSSPTIEDNVIRNNSASSLGAATWFEQSAAVIRGNLIEDNVRDGIHAVSCALVIEQNTIRGNGRGISLRQCQGRIVSNLIEDNSSTWFIATSRGDTFI